MKLQSLSMRNLLRKGSFLTSLGFLFVQSLSYCYAAPYLMDDFESGSAGWNVTAPWSVSSEFYHSPSYAMNDSHGSFYQNNVDASVEMASDLDFSLATHPHLSFYHGYSLEPDFDFGKVEVSTDSGASWSATPLATFTGNSGDILREELDLSSYAGESTVRIRFRLVTDGSVTMDGWSFDDVLVADAPDPVVLATPSGGEIGRNHVDLSWSASTAPEFASYLVMRSLEPNARWQDAVLVTEIADSSVTSFTDISLSPKTTYYYRVFVENASEMHAVGNEVSVTTLPGMDFPFIDTGESGGATWVADAPWALSDEDAWSPTHAWSDSPGADYADGIASQALTQVS